MSIERNFGRTLSGATDLSIDNIRLPNAINTIKINGFSGTAGMTIQKDSNNKLKWDVIDNIEIADNSIKNIKLFDKTIENNKIKDGTIISALLDPDIDITTTGNILTTLGNITATAGNITGNNLIATNALSSPYGYFDTVELPEIGTTTIQLIGSTGTITCEDININNHTGIIDFNEIRTNKLILPIVGTTLIELDGLTGDIDCSGNIVNSAGNITATTGDLISTAGDVVGTQLIAGSGIVTYGSLSSTGLTIAGDKDISAGGCETTISNLVINGSRGSVSSLISGDVLITNSAGDVPQDGDLTISHGDIEVTTGNIITTAGNITATAGDIISTAGDVVGTDLIAGSGVTTYGSLSSTGLTIGGERVISAGSCEATISNLVVSGAFGTDSVLISGDTTIIASAGDVPQDGDLMVTSGDIEATAGDVTGVQLFSKTGGTTHSSINSNGITLNGVQEIIAGDSKITSSMLVVNGAHGTASAVIGGNTAILASTGDTPQDGDLSVAGDYTSLNGNITLTNGTLFGNVEGTITEEIVDCKRINLREDVSVAGLTELNITSTGTNHGQINFVGGAVETAIDFDRRIVRSENDRILLNGNDGTIVATGDASFCESTSASSFLIDDSAGGNTYSNKCKNLNIGNTAPAITSAITMNGNITMVKNETILTGNSNIAFNKYRNNIRYFQLDGEYNRHTLTGTQRQLVVLRNSTDATTRLISIPNNLGISVGTYGYGQINYWWLDDVVAITPNIRIYMEVYVTEKVGTNGDLIVRIDSATGLASSYYPSQKSVTFVNNSTDKLARRFNFSILITGLTIGTKYDFIPKFGTSSLAQLYFNYGGIHGDMLLSYEFIDDYLITTSDPYAPSDDY